MVIYNVISWELKYKYRGMQKKQIFFVDYRSISFSRVDKNHPTVDFEKDYFRRMSVPTCPKSNTRAIWPNEK